MDYQLAQASHTNVTYGVLIEEVVSGGPAALAGLKVGTTTVTIAGEQYSGRRGYHSIDKRHQDCEPRCALHISSGEHTRRATSSTWNNQGRSADYRDADSGRKTSGSSLDSRFANESRFVDL